MTFAEQVEAWSYPPVDDVGYLSSASLLQLGDLELITLVRQMEVVRYQGWRNFEGRWRRVMGLDTTTDSLVLDYGCGTGIEALQYAKMGNRVLLGDISPTNLLLAERVFKLWGHTPAALVRIRERELPQLSDLDVIHCSGVLHHIPDAERVVKAMAGWLKPEGELRLMLYTDRSWRKATNTNPPENVSTHPAFLTYVRTMDGVGAYADWYDRKRLVKRFGKWFSVERCDYLTEDKTYLGAILRVRPDA